MHDTALSRCPSPDSKLGRSHDHTEQPWHVLRDQGHEMGGPRSRDLAALRGMVAVLNI